MIVRADQPGSQPIHIPEQQPNPVYAPDRSPTPERTPAREPAKVPEKVQGSRLARDLFFCYNFINTGR